MKLLFTPLLAALAAPAMAAIGASASLTGLRYDLVDLARDDGITPSVGFTSAALAQTFLGHYCGSDAACNRATGTFSVPAFADLAYGTGAFAGFASVTPAGLFAGGSFDNSMFPSGGPPHGPAYVSAARYRTQPGQPLFVLSAHTGLRITAQYTLDAWATPWTDAPHDYRDLDGTETSFASFKFQSPFIEGTAPSLQISAQTSAASPADFQHATGQVSVLLRNDLDHKAVLWGKWGVQTDGTVPGIPEPSTYALMLVGLVTVGATARRRLDLREC
ncbi:PEP-CTERM sorting domain-containing protein [Azohydromonas lata]|uniref:PEP-CTERM sorting domain-containing protein n=1 Tax=Azohydromonas lata TaxID=45677 RepID=A0ABU5IFX6_9BURK|nr:PEP-CTERM sorting domain-containing protein [Azohydromonas lata]MDZ5458021.1 PEP-CTERM sorting domain-containing protein [Azohydromonas lata]